VPEGAGPEVCVAGGSTTVPTSNGHSAAPLSVLPASVRRPRETRHVIFCTAVKGRYCRNAECHVKAEGKRRESPRCAPGTLLNRCRYHNTKKHTMHASTRRPARTCGCRRLALVGFSHRPPWRHEPHLRACARSSSAPENECLVSLRA